MNYNKITIPLISLLIFCLFWEWTVWFNGWPNYKMASPSDLWPAFWKFRWLFLSYGWDTLWRTIVGLSFCAKYEIIFLLSSSPKKPPITIVAPITQIFKSCI